MQLSRSSACITSMSLCSTGQRCTPFCNHSTSRGRRVRDSGGLQLESKFQAILECKTLCLQTPSTSPYPCSRRTEAWQHRPIFPAIQEAEVGGASLNPCLKIESKKRLWIQFTGALAWHGQPQHCKRKTEKQKSDCTAQCLKVWTLKTDCQGSNPSSYHLLDLELRRPFEL